MLHHQVEFESQDVEDTLDTFLAECRQAPDVGTSDAYGFGSESERLEYIRASADAAVDEYWNAAGGAVQHFRQAVDGCASAFFGASSVIRDDDSVDAVVDA